MTGEDLATHGPVQRGAGRWNDRCLVWSLEAPQPGSQQHSFERERKTGGGFGCEAPRCFAQRHGSQRLARELRLVGAAPPHQPQGGAFNEALQGARTEVERSPLEVTEAKISAKLGGRLETAAEQHSPEPRRRCAAERRPRPAQASEQGHSRPGNADLETWHASLLLHEDRLAALDIAPAPIQ